MKILVVDNNKNVADSISSGLEYAIVHYAADGEVGLELALETQFDLIVLNGSLPKKDGLSVMKALRENKILTPIMMMTGEDYLTNIVKSLDSGANDCVTKPFDIKILIARMKALVRRSKWDLCEEIRHDHIPHIPHMSVARNPEASSSCTILPTTIDVDPSL